MNRMEQPQREYAGYIFDLDGTLVDSMPQHYKAWGKALRDVGLPLFDEDVYYSMGGRAATDIVAEMAEAQGRSDIDPEEVARNKRMYYFEQLKKTPACPISEVIDFVRAHQGRVPLSIATGSALPGALETLKCAGLNDIFDIIVTPADVEHGKPAPDMFLLAAKKMGVPASECCVFEDADPGILGATRAGMDCVRVHRAS